MQALHPAAELPLICHSIDAALTLDPNQIIIAALAEHTEAIRQVLRRQGMRVCNATTVGKSIYLDFILHQHAQFAAHAYLGVLFRWFRQRTPTLHLHWTSWALYGQAMTPSHIMRMYIDPAP